MPEAKDESHSRDEATSNAPFPVPGAALTADQQIRLQEWFRTKWRHGECPVCHTNGYAAPDRTWEIRPFHGGGLVIGGPGGIIPMFPVTCTNCGYIIWINAILAGVIPGGSQIPQAPK